MFLLFRKNLSLGKISVGDASSGQALPLGIMLLAVLILCLQALYTQGRLLAQKSRLDQVADVAAYSGALVVARALNMQSFINLAQVGHQMAFANLATLSSWAQFARHEGQQAQRANPPVFLIGLFFDPLQMQAYQSAALSSATLNDLSSSTGALAQAMQAHQQASDFLTTLSYQILTEMVTMRNQAIQEVIQANYPHRKLGNSDDIRWSIEDDNLTQLLSWNHPKAHLFPFLQKIQKHYHFLDDRNYLQQNYWFIDWHCPWKHPFLRREGHTVLDQHGHWQSTDTLSFHKLNHNRWIGCYYREYPMGWGWLESRGSSKLAFEGKASKNQDAHQAPRNFAKQSFWRWALSQAHNIFGQPPNYLAQSYARRDGHILPVGHVAKYADLRDVKKQDKTGFTLKLTDYRIWKIPFTSQAYAETYFSRWQPRSDHQVELANLWHPYWLAHLAKKPSLISKDKETLHDPFN